MSLLILISAGIAAAAALYAAWAGARLGAALVRLEILFGSIRLDLGRLESVLREEISRAREETGRAFSLQGDSLSKRLAEIAGLQKNQLESFSAQIAALTQVNERKLDGVRESVENKLTQLQEDNSRKLEAMRETVDEKLHATLERRLGESFKLVGDRLELVHKGLGEMQTLAAGVGDLKKVLTNVKTRGIWGEIHLGALLDSVLTPDQFGRNVVTKKGANEPVEFAIKLPGRDGLGDPVWLPVDSKFPQEDYQRLLEAQERGDAEAAERAGKALEARIKGESKDIKEKYLDPPNTTDFGILFVPTEGLYAEVLRRPGLCEALQREFRVVLAGPTTLAALLNSLQMGFRTLAIEKRSSEVWTLLAGIKMEFGKFGELLDKTQKKLQETSNTIAEAAVRSRSIERKLKDVEELPSEQAALDAGNAGSEGK